MTSPKTKEYPFYFQTTTVLLGLVLVVFICSVLTDLLVPLAFAAFLSILLNPLCNRLQKWGVSQILAIILTLTIAVIFVSALFYFLSTQIAQFTESLPMLKSKFDSMSHDLQQWIEHKFGIATKKQTGMIQDALNNSQAMVGKTVGTLLGTLSIIFLLPVYMFLMLYYKTLILNFIFEIFKEENSKNVAEILTETKGAIQSYIVGLLIEMLIVAAMNSVALLLLGVKYAVLIGCIGAILNLIPYLGGIVAILLPVLMATVTKDGFTTQLGVIGAYAVIQFIDNNILVPRIVSSKVQINALISIIVVLLGNQLWGVSGMFLSIPIIAVLKIIFDRIDDLKPWGKLLGDTVPTHVKRWGRKPSVSEKIVEGKS
ncbi:AI-2E family transporter [Mucilaginibacter myungsuensis]|uniref:AI-2E family transporter n=1 Tax=Mucilaginibacter myungsuensis TaxID=649104 RepID=A0A929KYE4_9SPHI|nr:AI-2E family transporter [Mucilaginibacter myungsuensis]MBE9663447.1 AI-2E family transporter [Mucilaginibacter myungsuensis]MDN3600185.1 AI-2E family transporter [Mucilaginibacter myungsuensis]